MNLANPPGAFRPLHSLIAADFPIVPQERSDLYLITADFPIVPQERSDLSLIAAHFPIVPQERSDLYNLIAADFDGVLHRSMKTGGAKLKNFTSAGWLSFEPQDERFRMSGNADEGALTRLGKQRKETGADVMPNWPMMRFLEWKTGVKGGLLC